jgi:hypothetical protein
VSHVTRKEFDLQSWNFTGMLISMCSCAPVYFCVDLYSIFRVIALDVVQFCNFRLESHVTHKEFDIESWNFTGMLISMCRLVVDLSIFICFYFFLRFTALDLEFCLKCSNYVACNSKRIWYRVMKPYGNVAQHM